MFQRTKVAHNAMLNLDDLDTHQLKRLLQEYKDIAANGDAPEQAPEKTTAGQRERPAAD
ncbi:hypothetical protein H8F21_05510 [Pseudomonas sp. P66]|uniref:Uncharacterized protein n=2 Tax=Pseudomonas TaxID=286 RepID=A0ABS2BTR3_9PSED|nr:hypothetical protein [Pseudomonas arcuscaelestis]MBM5457029.1 hypothetical protein [Pseudomonas arcuscaelestis]